VELSDQREEYLLSVCKLVEPNCTAKRNIEEAHLLPVSAEQKYMTKTLKILVRISELNLKPALRK